MKKFIDKISDYIYRKRLKKWFSVNARFIWRKTRRFFAGEKFRRAVTGVPAVMTYIGIFVIAAVSVGSALFIKHGGAFFSSDEQILRRLSMQQYDESIPYLRALKAIGSSNRIQVTLKTEDENYIKPKNVGLDRGGVNILLTFSDGTVTEFALNNSKYDNFESGATDTFTLILPFGYTPFDITEYKIALLPDINNEYDSWFCKWARVYFLLENKPVMLAKETWEDVAVFGGGDNAVRSSVLESSHPENSTYDRAERIYSYYLKLAENGATEFLSAALRSDTLDALGLNAAKYINVDIETVNIEMQNNILTYYAKGVDIAETDSLDYDGRLYLDVTFLSQKPDGSYTESYLLDTLGTDDFELGTTSLFKLELPEGMCAFDISSISLRAENPYDSWAPHFVRVYIKPDYCDMLEIARLTDTMLIERYATPVFYKNLIDGSVSFDLSEKFAVPSSVKKQIEGSGTFRFGKTISEMYFSKLSFFERQDIFFARAADIFSASVYEPTQTEPADADNETEKPDAEPTEETKPDGEPDVPSTPNNSDGQEYDPDADLPTPDTDQVWRPDTSSSGTDTSNSGSDESTAQVWKPQPDEPADGTANSDDGTASADNGTAAAPDGSAASPDDSTAASGEGGDTSSSAPADDSANSGKTEPEVTE